MKKWFRIVKALTVLGAVVAVTTDFAAQVKENKGAPITLSAAGEQAAAAGIKTYRITKPKRSAADREIVVLEVDLLDASQMKIGRWSEHSKGSGDSRFRHTEFEFNFRKIATTMSGRSVRVVVDGQEIYSGPFAQADSATAAKIRSLGDLLKLMDAISRDVEKARHESEKLSSDWARVSFVPPQLRPVAMSLVRWLPAAPRVYASTLLDEEEGSLRCPSDPNAYSYCNFGEGFVRSTACDEAKSESAGQRRRQSVLCHDRSLT